MATKKISDLTPITTVSGTAILPVVQNGSTVKVTFENLTGSIASVPAADSATSASHAVQADSALTANSAATATTATSGTGVFSGSFSGSFVGDGSGLTGISGGSAPAFPYTGEAQITGSVKVTDKVEVYNKAGGLGNIFEISAGSSFGNGFSGFRFTKNTHNTVTNNAHAAFNNLILQVEDGVFNMYRGGAGARAVVTMKSADGHVSASLFSGSFHGDGSNLTGISATAFPYNGDAAITGSLTLENTLGNGNFVIGVNNNGDAQIGTGTNLNMLMKADGNNVLYGHVSASLVSGSFVGDGSGLTGITAVAFPYTGSAGISGSLAVNGPATISGLKISRGLNDNFSSLAIGDLTTLSNSTTGQLNLAVGYAALRDTTSGGYNVAIGYQSLQNNEAGAFNVAVGATALSALSGSAGSNTAVGARAQLFNTAGNGNVAIGLDSGRNNVNGNYNTAVGTNALFSTLGSTNTALGFNAGRNITYGGQNVILGYAAGPTADTSNKLFIHNSLSDNPLIYGDFSTRELTINGDLVVTGSLVATGSFSGSFVGDGSGLTGIVATFSQQTLSANDTTIASATILSAGSVNIVGTADVSNTAVRLDSPLFGSVTHVVNTSDRTIDVFPYDTGSAIYGEPSGSSVAVPNDGLMYTFTCIQNPGVGKWTFSTPTSAGTAQQRITLEETFNLTTVSGSGTLAHTITQGSWGATSTYVQGGPNAQCTVLAPSNSRIFWHPDFKNYKQISLVSAEVLTNIPTGDLTDINGDSVYDLLAQNSTGLITANPIVVGGVTIAQAYRDTYPGAPNCSVGGLGYMFSSFDPNFNANYINNSLNFALRAHVSLPGDPGDTGSIYQKYVRTWGPNDNRQDIFDSLGFPRIYWHAAAALGQNNVYRRQWELGNGLQLEFKVRVTFELYK